MVRAIQLLLFSQPQPLSVEVHKGYKVPYQLHCPPLAAALDELARLDIVGLLDDAGALELLTDIDELLPPLQISPLTTGCSAAPPFLST